MIDLHLHILPDLDDGPDSVEESVELARAAVEDGVRTVAATPHIRADHPRVVPSELGERCRSLASRLAAEGIGLEVVPGGEVDLDWAARASDAALQQTSYGQAGRDLLVETPYGPLPGGFEDRLFELALRGYRVLLAHPERNPTLQRDPVRLRSLVERGVLVQVTARSLVAEGRRSPVRKLAAAAIREGLAHVMATDAHGVRRRRRPDLAAGVGAAASIDHARAEWMVEEAPRAILAGADLEPPPLESRRRRLPPRRRGR